MVCNPVKLGSSHKPMHVKRGLKGTIKLHGSHFLPYHVPRNICISNARKVIQSRIPDMEISPDQRQEIHA